MNYASFNIKIVVLSLIALINTTDTQAQEVYSQAQNRIVQQAQTRATGAPIGVFLTFNTAMDPLRLYDAPKKEGATGFQQIDPAFQLVLGYESPFVLNNIFRFMLAFEFCGRYQFLENDLLSDYKKHFNYNLILGIDITPYLYMEFDSRGMAYVAARYLQRVSRNTYLLYQADTYARLWGDLYDTKGIKREMAWQYTSLDFVILMVVPVTKYINMLTIETGLTVRFQSAALNPHTHPDTEHSYNSEFPNWNELMYVALKTQMDIWLTPYVSLRPSLEFVMDGFEITSESVPFGLNMGVGLHFLI